MVIVADMEIVIHQRVAVVHSHLEHLPVVHKHRNLVVVVHHNLHNPFGVAVPQQCSVAAVDHTDRKVVVAVLDCQQVVHTFVMVVVVDRELDLVAEDMHQAAPVAHLHLNRDDHLVGHHQEDRQQMYSVAYRHDDSRLDYLVVVDHSLG